MTFLSEQLGDKYEVLEKVRVGGMGAIYKVRHRLLDEIRVVKVVRRPGAEGSSADRFLREARVVIKLHHPNVAILHDFAVGTDGQAFIVMEYIEGWNLLEVLRAYGPPPLPMTIEIARQSLKALGYLHRHKIVHRDISPDNLMLSRDEDGNPLVKLIDLGIAKALEEKPEQLTAAGMFLGKPRYGSPERFNGSVWDERSDLYSFGVVLYELLTGCCPIAGSDPASLMAGHLFLPPRDFGETDPGGRVPEELRAIVLKALAKKPADRMASADDFLWLLSMIQDRHPLTAASAEPFWRVFHCASSGASPGTPGSSIPTPRAIPLAMVRSLEAERLAAENAENAANAAKWAGPELPPPPETQIAILPAMVQVELARAAAGPAKPRRPDTWASHTLSVPVEEPEAATDPSPLQTAKVRASRRPLVWFAVAGFALGLIVVGIWLEQFRGRLRPPPSPPPKIAAAPPISPETTPEATPAPLVTEVQESLVQAEESPVSPPISPVVSRPLPPMAPGNMILRSFPGIQEPEVRLLPRYSYPAAAKGTGKRVSIRVAVLVDENGQVMDAHVRDGDRSGLGFEEVALTTARKAKFFPATRDGIAGKMWTEILLDFAE